MKGFISALTVLFIMGCSVNSGEADKKQPPTPKKHDIWVNTNNFKQFPSYLAEEEFGHKPENGECLRDECTALRVGSNIYLYGKLVTENNFKDLILGTWTGGDCRNDAWHMDDKGNFKSKFPRDGEDYSWSGTYKFESGIYSEDGINNSGDKEMNTANLFYFPYNGYLLYRGLSGVENIDDKGKVHYTYYHGPQFYYFKRCEN